MEKILAKYKENIAKLKSVQRNTDDEFIKNGLNILIYRIKSRIEEIEDETEPGLEVLNNILSG